MNPSVVTTMELAEKIIEMFEIAGATESEQYSAIQMVSSLIPLSRIEYPPAMEKANGPALSN